MILLSIYQVNDLLLAKKRDAKEAEISLDLGISLSKVIIEDEYFVFPDGNKLKEDQLKKIIKKDTMVFRLEGNEIFQIAIFSDETNNYYKLVPTGKDTPPTIEISGIRMHVTKKFSPREDTKEKVSYVAPCIGNVLDTCTGLGYTAIEASKTANLVFTIDRDENVIELEKVNPYSKELFDNPKIKRIYGDSYDEIKKFKSCYFDRIIHDPPRQAISTLLYSQGYYNELYRVLARGGKLFHYTGDPGSKRGLDIRAGIIKRLATSKFKNIQRVFNGVTADKL